MPIQGVVLEKLGATLPFMKKDSRKHLSFVIFCAFFSAIACHSESNDGQIDPPMNDASTADASTDASLPSDPNPVQGCQENICFQPAFHQALRENADFAATTTLRLFIPLGRAGSRLKVTLRSGPRELKIERALVSRVSSDGSSVSGSTQITFDAEGSALIGPRESLASDAIPFSVAFRETIAITLVVRGSAAASAIELFPENQMISGDHAQESTLAGATPFSRAIALANLSVEGPRSRAFIALGDSITEGYVEGDDRYVESWPAVTESRLALPVVNAGVSGQGLDGALEYLNTEILSVEGITDCVILLGTNDLGGTPLERIEMNYDQLIDRLLPFCRVHLGVLPPKEKPETQADRAALNTWIRAHTKASSILDFESVLAAPGDTTCFATGLGMDGIHPTVEGQFRMGRFAAEAFE